MEIGNEDGRPLYVTVASTPVQPADGTDRTLLEPNIEIYGDEATVHAALSRWHNPKSPLSPLAATAQRLAASYDAWFVMSNPLASPEFADIDAQSPRVKELVNAIEEVRAGLRFGSIDEASVEIDTKSSEDAAALAVLGRYLPALLESRRPPESILLKLADRVISQSHGRTATLSLSIDEHRLEEASREFMKGIIK
jgi:hypothetical protein